MIKYVVGFLFNEKMDQVVLIKKNRPEWQKGFYNGVGGKIEEGETPETAMTREFEEEAGLKINEWYQFCQIGGMDYRRLWERILSFHKRNEFKYRCYFYFAISEEISKVTSKTDEVICRVDVDELSEYNVIENLKWLIPMCKDANQFSQFNCKIKLRIKYE